MEKLTRAEMAPLVEGWSPRIMDMGSEVVANLGAAGTGAMASTPGKTTALMLVGGAGSLLRAALGPSFPWTQLLLAPFSGMWNGATAIRTYQMVHLTSAGREAVGE